MTPEKAPKQKYKVPMSLCEVEKTQREMFPKRLDEKKEKAPAIFPTNRKNAVFRNNSLKKRRNYISRLPRNYLELYIHIITLYNKNYVCNYQEIVGPLNIFHPNPEDYN